MPKKTKTNKSPRTIYAGGLIAIVVLAIIFAVILINKNNNDLSFFYAKDSTNINKYHLTKENKEFIRNIAIDEEFYKDLNEIYKIKDKEFVVYLYSEYCGDNCLNNEVIEHLKELQKKGNIIYSVDYNRISNVSYSILTNGGSSLEDLSFLYVKEGRIVDVTPILDNDYSYIPTKENNSYEFLIGLENSEDKRAYLVDYYKEIMPDISEEDLEEIVDSYMTYIQNN